jgi:hypothetical protein
VPLKKENLRDLRLRRPIVVEPMPGHGPFSALAARLRRAAAGRARCLAHAPGLARRVPQARTEDVPARTCSRAIARTSACQAFSQLALLARTLRPRRVGEHGRRPRATRVRRLRLRKGRVSDPKAWRGPPRREATREMKSPGSGYRRGIGQRPKREARGMRRACPIGGPRRCLLARAALSVRPHLPARPERAGGAVSPVLLFEESPVRSAHGRASG